jgi:3-methyl-2-oxobutanoate hydroxymethyltransferase
MNARTTIADLLRAKQEGRAIVAVSCYDHTTARLVSQAGIDMVLVGDSAAQFVLGFDSTLPASMDLMVALTAAVRRGAQNVYLVADMPFLSYQVNIGDAIRNAGRFLIEGGAQMVKIEATTAHLETIRAVSNAGIAVMAHIGIRPQRIGTVGRFRAEATTADMAMELIALAEQMLRAGASMLLLEGVAAEVAQIITDRAGVPVISCGSGSGCDGQILVAPDILGLLEDKPPKFAKAYADLGARSAEALGKYADEVRGRRFPDSDHSYHMKAGEIQRLAELLGPQRQPDR